jgi:hypothetical protein
MMKTIQNLFYQKIFSKIYFSNKIKLTVKFHTNKTVLPLIPHPVPASKAMPTWFKKIKPVVKGCDISDAGTVKRCMPVLDAVSEGFIIPLWADLKVKVTLDEEKNDLNVWVNFAEFDVGGIPEMLGTHSWDQVGNACDLKKFKLGKVLMKFMNPWTIQTPKGYSVKFKNPADNWSNNIEIIEGIVDTDEYYNPANLPFVWTGSEVGEWIIPQGTPLVHVIPFKREKYNLEVGLVNDKKAYLVYNKLSAKFIDRYKSLFWHKRKDR